MTVNNNTSTVNSDLQFHELVAETNGRWAEIFSSFRELADAAEGGPSRHVRCPFPDHIDHDPSFRISSLETGAAICSCNRNWSNGFQLIADLRQWTMQQVMEYIDELLDYLPPPLPRPNLLSTPDRRTQAISLWEQSSADTGIVATYLRSRGLSGSFPPTIRLGFSYECPAAICAVQQSDGSISGVHRIHLAHDGSGKAAMHNSKLSLGTTKGGAVRLGEPTDDYIYLCEGVETGLAVMEAVQAPVWACLSTSGLKSVELPDKIRRIVICADNDSNGAGWQAAENAARRFVNEGRQVWIAMPEVPGNDWLDEYIQRGAAGVQESLQSLTPWIETSAIQVNADEGGEAVEAWEPFPVDALPDPARQYVLEASKSVACDPAYLALPVLSVLASAIGNTRCVALKDDWRETRRPYYTAEQQQVCLDVRRRNSGIDGQPIIFYATSPKPAAGTRTNRKPKANSAKTVSRYPAIVEGVKSLGLNSATASQVEQTIRKLFPVGISNIEQGEVIRVVFVSLMRQNSTDNLGR